MNYLISIVVIVVVFIILYKVFQWVFKLLVLAIFLAIAFYTNPTEEQHKAAVVRKAEKNDISMKGKLVDRENYIVFSLTKLSHQERSTVVGVGAFTKVLIFDTLEDPKP
jgi:uncharacterized membrane protein